MKKIVIIGANDFQKPLIQKAKEMGYETHVFAWREGATGAEDADFFYEISIVEMDAILEECRKIKPDAVATIGSDLANITVQYLAEKLGLPGNSSECIRQSTNKYAMRSAFQKAGIPVPYFACVGEGESVKPEHFPVVVKPTDRSGSRAITKVTDPSELPAAIEAAIAQSFEKKAWKNIFPEQNTVWKRSAIRENTPALQSPGNLRLEVRIISRLVIYSRLH